MLYLLLLWSLGGLLVSAGFSGEGESLPESGKSLKSLFVLSVHGIRPPRYGTFVGDPGALKYPIGQSYLTEKGKLLMKHAGLSLNSRYSHFLTYKTDLWTRIVTAFPTAFATDSAKALSSNFFEGKYIPKTVTSFAGYFDKTSITDEPEERSVCPRYACLRDRERNKRFRITSNQRKFYKLFSQKSGVQTESSEIFYQIYDRLQMEKLNNDPVPDWFDKLDPIRSGWTRRRWMKKRLGYNEGTYKFITDPLVRWMVSIFQLDPTVFKYDPIVAAEPGSKRRVQVHVSEDVLVSALGWVLFAGSYEKEFGRPFVVEVGDVLLLEVHDILDQYKRKHEILKVFYYSPITEDPEKRFKELSLQSYLDSKGLRNWKIFATGFLKLLTFKSSFLDECRIQKAWYKKLMNRCKKYTPKPE